MLPHPPPQDSAADLAHRLRRAAERSAAGLRATLAAHGFADLPAGGWSLLCVVAARAPLSPGEAAAALGVSAASVSQSATALQRDGWLREAGDARDARVRQLVLGPRALAHAIPLQALRRALDAAWREALGAHATSLEQALLALERTLEAEPLAARVGRHA